MFTLYKVGSRGRVPLEGVATEGDYYTADKRDDGVITLTPVKVNTTSTRITAYAQDDDPDA